jgi:hypothetical protein
VLLVQRVLRAPQVPKERRDHLVSQELRDQQDHKVRLVNRAHKALPELPVSPDQQVLRVLLVFRGQQVNKVIRGLLV